MSVGLLIPQREPESVHLQLIILVLLPAAHKATAASTLQNTSHTYLRTHSVCTQYLFFAFNVWE